MTNLNNPDPSQALLPKPTENNGVYTPNWNTIALFFNLPSAQQPANYMSATDTTTRQWMFSNQPGFETLSSFVSQYWAQLSYGNFAMGVDYLRNPDGSAFIPDINLADAEGSLADPDLGWALLIDRYLEANAEAVWKAADPNGNGLITEDGKRWIPSVVLVQPYEVGAFANGRVGNKTYGGVDYYLGDRCRLSYFTPIFENDNVTLRDDGRQYWVTLCHELGHCFLEFGDLYGPAGATYYWDLMGGGGTVHRMPDVFSATKAQNGWLEFKEVIEGPNYSTKHLVLHPYATTGDAIKVIPDPIYTPHEYFLLEYRRSTGGEDWRPDGGLIESGLIITHVNTSFKENHLPWTLRDAPFYDVEMANFRDQGGTLRIGVTNTTGNFFPLGDKNSFTPYTQPSSQLYGGRSSGLFIRNIEEKNQRIELDIEINGYQLPGWHLTNQDHYVAGRFSRESLTEGSELLVWNNRRYALLTHHQAQFVARFSRLNNIANIPLSEVKLMLSGNFNGNNAEHELYVRTSEFNGLLKLSHGDFDVMDSSVALWTPEPGDREYVVNATTAAQQQLLLVRGRQWHLWNYVDGQMQVIASAENRIGNAFLVEDQQIISGRFRGLSSQEWVVFNPGASGTVGSLGIVAFNEDQQNFEFINIQGDTIGSWNFSANDELIVADLDGDGSDEIYLRSATDVGVLKWDNSRFSLMLHTQEFIEDMSGEESRRLMLSDTNRSFSGRLQTDRDGIVHRTGGSNDQMFVIVWDNNTSDLRVRYRPKVGSYIQLQVDDQVVLADFHPQRMDIARPTSDYVTDNIDDVFIANSARTMLISANPAGGLGWGVSWLREDNIMLQRPTPVERSVKSVFEDSRGRNETFMDTVSGAVFGREAFVNMIEAGLYPSYHIRVINGVKTPVSNPNAATGDNLE